MRSWLFVSILFLLNPAFSQTAETFHLINFTPPQGWAATPNDLFRQYTHNGQNQNTFCVIMIYGSSYSAGNPADDFREEWETRIIPVATAAETVKPSAGTTSTGISYMEGGSQLAMNDGSRLYAHMVVLSIGDKRQSLLYILGSKDMLKIYQNDLRVFLSGIMNATVDQPRATEGKKPSMENPAIPEVPSNLGTFYHGYETRMVGSSAGNSPVYLYLFPDNSFQWGYFQHGYYNYNKVQEQKAYPDFCGTYTRNGNVIGLNFYKSSYHPEFTTDQKGNLKSNSGSYTLFKLPALKGLALEGTYSVELWSDGPKPKATFHLNGRFEDNALLCSGEAVDYTIPPNTAQQRMNENKIPGKGSFRIIDHTLILHYDDGRWRQLLFYVVDLYGGKPERIVVAGQTYTLVK